MAGGPAIKNIAPELGAGHRGAEGARVILYAGERQGVPIVMHGPFVAENRADLMRLSRLYLDGKMPRVSELDLAHAATTNG